MVFLFGIVGETLIEKIPLPFNLPGLPPLLGNYCTLYYCQAFTKNYKPQGFHQELLTADGIIKYCQFYSIAYHRYHP